MRPPGHRRRLTREMRARPFRTRRRVQQVVSSSLSAASGAVRMVQRDAGVCHRGQCFPCRSAVRELLCFDRFFLGFSGFFKIVENDDYAVHS